MAYDVVVILKMIIYRWSGYIGGDHRDGWGDKSGALDLVREIGIYPEAKQKYIEQEFFFLLYLIKSFQCKLNKLTYYVYYKKRFINLDALCKYWLKDLIFLINTHFDTWQEQKI